jgi:hypothetical protein
MCVRGHTVGVDRRTPSRHLGWSVELSQALLQVTMRKLEHASEAAQRSTTAGERMTEQLKRATANEAAAVAAAHQAAEMVKVEQDSRSELKQANDLVARVAELQRTHYQNKNDLLRTLLGDKTQLTHADESLEM